MKATSTAILLVSLLFAGGSLQAHQPHDCIVTVAVSPDYESDATLFCSLSHINSFVLKSTDRGETWWPAQTGLPYGITKAFAISPDFASDGILFAAISRTDGPSEVYRSDDRGATWTLCSDGLPGQTVRALAISPDFANDGILFAGTTSGIFRSLDGGNSWSRSEKSPLGQSVNAITLSPALDRDMTLFAATSQCLFKSIDGGVNWFNPTAGGWSGSPVTDVVLSPGYACDERLFVSVLGVGLLSSTDGGQTWKAANWGLFEAGKVVTSLAISPDFSADGTVYAATRAAGVFKTTDSGDLWQAANVGLDEQAPQTDVHYFDLAISPAYAEDGTVFLAAWEGLHRSQNGADRWRHLDVFSQKMIRGLALSPDFAADGTLFAGSYGGGAYKSTNGGDDWEAFSEGLTSTYLADVAVSPAYALDRTVFAGITDHAMKTDSSRWVSVPINPPDHVIARTLALSPGYPSDGTFFVGNDFSGTHPLYRTRDGGLTFDCIDPGFTAPRSLVLSPAYTTDQTIFIGNAMGVIRSTDGGDSWEMAGLTETRIHCLALSPDFASSRTLFAGTMDRGVQRSTDGGDNWTPVNMGLPEIITVESLAVSPAFAERGAIFAGTRGRGVYRSRDGGDRWEPSGLEAAFVRNLVCSPAFAMDGTLFAGGWNGVHRSRDRGTTWERILHIRRLDDLSEFIIYRGDWKIWTDPACHGKTIHVSQEANDWAGTVFEGDAIAWIGTRSPWGGRAKVLIDSVFQENVDTYANENRWQEVLFEASGLAPGPHTIVVVNLGRDSSSSYDSLVAVDAFETRF